MAVLIISDARLLCWNLKDLADKKSGSIFFCFPLPDLQTPGEGRHHLGHQREERRRGGQRHPRGDRNRGQGDFLRRVRSVGCRQGCQTHQVGT